MSEEVRYELWLSPDKKPELVTDSKDRGKAYYTFPNDFTFVSLTDDLVCVEFRDQQWIVDIRDKTRVPLVQRPMFVPGMSLRPLLMQTRVSVQGNKLFDPSYPSIRLAGETLVLSSCFDDFGPLPFSVHVNGVRITLYLFKEVELLYLFVGTRVYEWRWNANSQEEITYSWKHARMVDFAKNSDQPQPKNLEEEAPKEDPVLVMLREVFLATGRYLIRELDKNVPPSNSTFEKFQTLLSTHNRQKKKRKMKK